MEKAFSPLQLRHLGRWIFDDLEHGDTVLGIPKANFQVPEPRFASQFQGRPLAAPLGMAAGPHTQLAQNLVAGWLCGARFMELKTIQILDELQVSRPCIDAAFETYNCEWSQELKLEASFQEYLNAWVLIHALAHRLGLPGPGSHFAMSVGYNLEGIQSPRVQAFIAAMRDAGPRLDAAVAELAEIYPPVRDLDIPRCLSNHITLSTMHGCPPSEIERIARYLLTEVKCHTWIKLNPTLLGPERLRGLLNDTLGFDIEVPDQAFEHDPGFPEAMAMVRNLAALAADLPVEFGLKLSNTLEVVNRRRVFPEHEQMMYMSGRSLHPLTLRLAQEVREELRGQVKISFCGGADALNFPELVADGLGPVTVCSDLLKPGGYARLQQYLVNLGGAFDRAGVQDLAGLVAAAGPGALAAHAAQAAGAERFQARTRPFEFKGPRALGAFDCIAAPCQETCPAHQNIPDYLWQVAHGRPDAALEVIRRDNPLAGITGSVCDHPCTERCVRNFFDAPVGIREIKRYAFEQGQVAEPRPLPRLGVRVAIVGAGPAGISAAYFLTLMGFDAEIFEARQDLGGMAGTVIPPYRIGGRALADDFEHLARLGVPIHRGVAIGRDLALDRLRADFRYVFLGVGAARGKRLGIPGEDGAGVLDALEFLGKVKAQAVPALGAEILVIGGGNSAMDAARSARRLAPEGRVTLVYRRMRAQMPADPAEVQDCLDEGIQLRDLLAPARVVHSGGRLQALACTPMRLGERDASGRPRPVPGEGPEVLLAADTIITAISQEPELGFLDGLALARHPDGSLALGAGLETSVANLFAGGDLARGPASVVKAMADGRQVAAEIGRRHGVALPEAAPLDKGLEPAQVLAGKASRKAPVTVPALPISGRGGFDEVLLGLDAAAAEAEAARCLDCDEVCSLCVTVCPNRANLAFRTAPMELLLPSLVMRAGSLEAEAWSTCKVTQPVQIINLGDACNECGNCVPFCPTSGAPYLAKTRFWLDRNGFENSPRDGVHLSRQGGTMIFEARIAGAGHLLASGPDRLVYQGPEVEVDLDPRRRTVRSWTSRGPIKEGAAIDLQALGLLLALLPAANALPA